MPAPGREVTRRDAPQSPGGRRLVRVRARVRVRVRAMVSSCQRVAAFVHMIAGWMHAVAGWRILERVTRG
eukprot:scaffold20281_cov48-Phaeocystis_antarctica.AAC.6